MNSYQQGKKRLVWLIALVMSLSGFAQSFAACAWAETAGEQSGSYTFGISGDTAVTVSPGTQVELLEGMSFTPEEKDWKDGDEFRLAVSSVDTPQGGSYTYQNGDTAFTVKSSDAGKTYTIHYAIQKKDGDTWKTVSDSKASAEKEVIVYRSTQTKDSLDSDDAYISSFKVTNITDGTGPFDENDEAGNDSADNNKIVRSFDSVTYDLSYSLNTYSAGTTYKEGYVWFEFELPYTADKATFDTASMNWMSTDKGYKWELTEKDGKQVLKCARKRELTEGNEASIPGSGDVSVALQIYGLPNGEEVKPTFKAWVDHNETEGECAKHDKNEVRTLSPDPVKVSAAPSYNVQLKRLYDSHCSIKDTWDFSTGNDRALNQDAGQILGREQGYGFTLQLYNKDKSKGLKGIEYPEGPITFDVKVSAKYVKDSDPKNPVDITDEAVPLVWSYDAVNSADDNNADGRKTQTKQWTHAPNNTSETDRTTKIASSKTGTPKCWNGGNWNAVQNGDTVTFTVSDYEINGQWFPSTDLGLITSQPKLYFDPAKGVENIGCFSGGEMFLIVPFETNKGEKLEEKYGSGTIQLTVEDVNLNATSESGQKLDTAADNTNQANTADDSRVNTVYLAEEGEIINRVQYSYRNNKVLFAEDVNVSSVNAPAKNNGKDVTSIGSKIEIMAGASHYPNGDVGNAITGGDYLLKFDDKALEYDPSVAIQTTLYEGGNWTTLFAARKDGSGWSDDQEMKETDIEDLVYYKSYTELQTDGKTCVGVLLQVRNAGNTQAQSYYNLMAVPFIVKNDPSLCGGVYQTVSESNVWIKKDVTDESDMPSLLDVQSGRVTVEEYKAKQWKKNFKYDYQKATYDADGNYTGGHTGTNNQGDSLYLVAYKSSIGKTVEQLDSNGDTKKVYDLDYGQYTVDYELSPSMEVQQGVTWNNTTTMTITDVLPAGMEYVAGSAVYGGTYQAAEKAGNAGTVQGGTALEPSSITENADGTTTLVWKITDVAVEKELPAIHFKAKMDSATKKNTQFENTASICTSEDTREANTLYGNKASVGVTTSKVSDLSLSKKAKQLVYDAAETIEYEAGWYNNGKNAVKDAVLMDTMPQNGDLSGSSFSGTYTVSKLTITPPEGSSADQFEIWYSTDDAAKTLSSDQLKASEIRAGSSGGASWKKAAMASDGTVSLTADAAGMKAWVCLGDLAGGGQLKADVAITPNGSKAADRFCNRISLGSAYTEANAYIADRMLKGVVWEDSDLDGKRSSSEKRIAGVTVSLCDDQGNIIKDQDGKECLAVTDARGAYEFDRLPAGTYTVKFTSGDTELGAYRATVQNAPGADETVNSDAEPQYAQDRLSSACITGISLPENKDIKTSPYVVAYQDLGLWKPGTLELAKTISGNAAEKDRAFTFTFAFSMDGWDQDSAEFDYEKSDGTAGTVTSGGTITLKGGESVTIKNIPQGVKYDITESDNENYTVTEKNTEGTITASVSKAGFNNDWKTYSDLKVTKKWVGTGTHPDEVYAQLYKDGEAEGDPVRLSDDNNWTHTFKDLYDGNEWTVKECDKDGNEPAIDGFTNTEISQDEKSGDITIVNTEVPKKSYSKDTPAGADGAQVRAGDTIKYDISYANGGKDAADVVITDKLDENVEYAGSTDGGVYDEQTHTVTWTLKDVTGYTAGRVSLSVRVKDSARTAAKVENTAAVKIGNGSEVRTQTLKNTVEPDRTAPQDPGSNGNGGHGVKTGDGMPVLMLAALMTAAMLAALLLIVTRRRAGRR